MKTFRNTFGLVGLALVLLLTRCTSSSESEIVGRYAGQSENGYDYFKDTIEIRATDDGKFDVQTIAVWSAAMRDMPDRPNENKKAGLWSSGGPGEVEVADFQQSDHTLRISDPMTGRVRIIAVDLGKKTIEKTTKDGRKLLYHKVQE